MSRTYSRRNSLDEAQVRILISEYSTTSNKALCHKFRISKTQLTRIVRQYGLKSKNIVPILGTKREIEEFDGVCGVYAVVIVNEGRCLLGGAKDIGAALRKGGWLEPEVWYSLVERVDDEKELKERVNDYLLRFDSSVMSLLGG